MELRNSHNLDLCVEFYFFGRTRRLFFLFSLKGCDPRQIFFTLCQAPSVRVYVNLSLGNVPKDCNFPFLAKGGKKTKVTAYLLFQKKKIESFRPQSSAISSIMMKMITERSPAAQLTPRNRLVCSRGRPLFRLLLLLRQRRPLRASRDGVKRP